MADRSNRKFRHFILDGFTETKRFQSPQQGGTPKVVPERDRKGHGAALLNQLTALKAEAENARLAQEDAGFEEGIGIQVEFESFPDIELAFESLSRERSGIELLNDRHLGNRTYATVFVPDGKLDHFERLIHDYLKSDRACHQERKP